MAVPLTSIFDAADYDAEIARAADRLNAGGVVVLPTETVYGAAASLVQSSAIVRLRSIRAAAEDKPFTIHLARREDAANYIAAASTFAQRMMRKLWPGPVGLIFDVPPARRQEVIAERKVKPELLYDDHGSITLRCPDHIVATDVLSRVAGPVALTAAAGSVQSPAANLARELEGRADLILDAGPTHYSKPSTLLRVKEDGYDIVRAGVYDERIIERMLRTTILFVCSGNTCRSAMAEALARGALAERLSISVDELEKRGISVISAGSFAVPGARATPQAVEALKAMGADLTRHRSRPLTVELVHQADVIYTMSRAHAAAVIALVPSAADKTVTLNPGGDIEDPIGGDLALYQELAGQIRAFIDKRLDEKVPQLL